MPFQYENYRSPYIGAIADLMKAGPEQQAALAISLAKIDADRLNNQALIKARAWGNIGQSALDVGASMQRERELAPQREMQQLQLVQARQDAVDTKLLRDAYAMGDKGDTYLASLGALGAGARQKLGAVRLAEQKQAYEQGQQRATEAIPAAASLVSDLNDPIPAWNAALPGLRSIFPKAQVEAWDAKVTENPAEAPSVIGSEILMHSKEGRDMMTKNETVRRDTEIYNPTMHRTVAVGPKSPPPQTSRWTDLKDQYGIDYANDLMTSQPQSRGEWMNIPGKGVKYVEIVPGKGSSRQKAMYQGIDVTDIAQKPPSEVPAAIKVWQFLQGQQGDAPAVSPYRPEDDGTLDKPNPKLGGLTKNGVFEGGISYALTGQVPATSRGGVQIASQMQRDVIANTGAAMARVANIDLADLRREFAAEAAADRRLTYTANATAGVAAGAINQLDLALELSKKVSRTDIPMVNRYAQWIKGELTSAPDLGAFEIALYSAARDAAKVTSGAAGSIAGVPVSAAEKADRLLAASHSPERLAAEIGAMKKDVGNVAEPLMDQVRKVAPVTESFIRAVNGYGAQRFSDTQQQTPPPKTTPPPTTTQTVAPPKMGDRRVINGTPAVWATQPDASGKPVTGWWPEKK